MSVKKVLNLFFVFFLSVFITVHAQTTEQPKIKLTDFLSTLSEQHKVFFTYDAEILKNINVAASLTEISDLQLVLNKLRTQTNLYFDNINANYYIIYKNSDKAKYLLEKAKQKQGNKEQLNSSKTINSEDFFVLKGTVINIIGSPLFGASIIDKKSKKGTTSDTKGFFSLKVAKNSLLTISYIGYTTKTFKVGDDKNIIVILEQGEFLEEVKLVGSRNRNRTLDDTPTAIDVIDIQQTSNKTGQVELNQLLQYAVPSFNATKQSGADGADHIDPATLRGLGPDQTLVLINGKRRHQSSLINLYGTRGRGNSGTDLNAIPSSAIKRIEVLRDGAAAQYGSDAIAGVINIILKDDVDSFLGNVTYGIYNAKANGNFKNPTQGFDGNTMKFSGNYGLKIRKKGFLSISTEFLSKEKTRRPGADFRKKYGEAGLNQYSLFLNSEVPLNASLSFYANAGYSFRDSESYAFTRKANSARNVLDIYPNGFTPLITAAIVDASISGGFKTKINDWNIDINNTYGSNHFSYNIKETLNATLLLKSPTSFDAGGHSLKQNTTSIDFNKYYNDILNGINIAFGTEYRIETYKIFAGEVGSYATFDINGDIVTQQTPQDNLVRYEDKNRPGGSQGFPGYSTDNEIKRSRSNLSLYVDTEFDINDNLMLGGAFRYEKYSDFGNSFNFKLSNRYKISDNFRLRATLSSGFRAPSLAQMYYNLKFTNFIGSKPSESLLEPNDSPITRQFGIGKLREEKAINSSLGFTAKIKNFKVTVDGYFIGIKDRIILTGNFDASNLNSDFKDVQFFANGVNTKTLGVDAVFTWSKKRENDEFSVSLASNFNVMSIEQIKNNKLDEETFFGVRDQYFLLASAPKSKINLNLNYNYKRLNANINITRFSSLKLVDWQIIKPLELEEPTSSYIDSKDRFNKSLDYYKPKITTDFNLGYFISPKVLIHFGVNNFFNTYPTQQNSSFTDSGGYWDSVQMGTNGTFYYSKITYKF